MTEGGNRLTISFVIPVLNGEKYVEGCLNSVISQMEPDDEIIMVDNGSTDNSVAIAGRFNRVQIIDCPGSTISAVRNFGSTKAAGDTLAFIDIDCLIQGGWRKAVESVLSDRSIDATGSLYDLPENPAWVEKVWWSSKPAEPTRTNYMVGGNFVIRKEVFQAIGGFDEKLVTDEDSDMGARLNRGGYVIVGEPGVGAIHLGNPKTLREFVVKEKWHSSSIIETMKRHGLDKPMVMTFAFMACSLLSFMDMAFSIIRDGRAPLLLPAVLFVPVLTAAYRIYQFGQYRFVFHLTVLYFLFYMVRSITIIETLIRRGSVR